MQKLRLHKLFAAPIVAALLMVSFASVVWAMGEAAPVLQQVRAREVRGILTGGQFAKIWLGLEPETVGAQVTVIAEWDRNQPADQGLNFFILDDQGIRRIGDDSLSTIALGAGSANFVLNGPANVLGASFNANGLGPYTLVVVNDSSQDASFTLRVTNGFITDGSGQVVDPSAPTTAITTTTATTGTTAAPAATTAPAVATAAVTTTTATTSTTAATTTVAATATPAPAATTATVAPVVGGVARATSLSGSLPEQNDQHFLGLEPEGRDTQVTLRLTIEPQDSSELARRLNFWVLDEAGFKQFVGGTDASDVAIAAGNRVFRGLENERVASFRATGTGSYTVIVYNNATVPGSYGLSIEGGLLVDDNGQTNESKRAGVSATGTLTGTATTTGTTTTTATTTASVSATTATTAITTTAATARAGQPGGTYTVKSGDTLALIARDIYGDLDLYDELCAFNKIADCNVIEVGDAVRLPTTAQISAGATAAPTATPRATPAAAATPAATTPVTSTQTTTGTTTSGTTTSGTATTAPSTSVQPSTTVTSTGTTTGTTGTTGSTGSTTGSTAGGTSILATLTANGNFNTLVKALKATGLDSSLSGATALTLFAPTDAAFVALRNDFNLSEAALLALPELKDVLRYHVLNEAVTSAEITDGLTEPTLQGKTVRFGVNGASTTVNGANVIAADVEAGSGVIHVIDAVIIPPTD